MTSVNLSQQLEQLLDVAARLYEATASEAMFGLPDSGDMPTVIAPDLSNLPAGETAINPETGEEFTRGG